MIRETSIESYNTIKDNGLLSERRLQVYEALFREGPLTGTELSRALQKQRIFINPNLVRSRLIELRNLGVAREIGETICTITGLRVIQWDVTANTPSKAPAKKSPKNELEEIWRAISELKEQIGKAVAIKQLSFDV